MLSANEAKILSSKNDSLGKLTKMAEESITEAITRGSLAQYSTTIYPIKNTYKASHIDELKEYLQKLGYHVNVESPIYCEEYWRVHIRWDG